jgi:pimeloyl-ACP methyl ester carboxylesterase
MVADLLGDLGLDRPHVAGNSLGGWIALELAKAGQARSATALSPAGFYDHAEAVFLRVSLRATRQACRMLRADAPRVLAHPTVRRVGFFQLVAHGDRIGSFDAVETVRGVADATWFDETLVALVAERFYAADPIGVPVTIAWGEHDRLLLRRQATRAARQLPDARSVTLRGCGHVPTYDDPEQVARVLLEGSAQASG